jgi:hypothetical protein
MTDSNDRKHHAPSLNISSLLLFGKVLHFPYDNFSDGVNAVGVQSVELFNVEFNGTCADRWYVSLQCRLLQREKHIIQ